MSRLEPAILFQNERFLVLDKPAGWHCVEARRTDGAPTVMTWLRDRRPAQGALPESGLVHRLDRETTGCLVVAKDGTSLEDLRAGFADSPAPGMPTITKTYLALLSPGLPATGDWSFWFSSRHARSSKVTVSMNDHTGLRGECRWRVLHPASLGRRVEPGDLLKAEPRGAARTTVDPRDAAAFDLAAIELVGPGRRHQIRAGFASMGHPLAGDTLYGGTPLRWSESPPSASPTTASARDSTLALHAWRIAIDGVCVEAPPPAWADAAHR